MANPALGSRTNAWPPDTLGTHTLTVSVRAGNWSNDQAQRWEGSATVTVTVVAELSTGGDRPMNHGWCVSQAAQATDATGGSVSDAARSGCNDYMPEQAQNENNSKDSSSPGRGSEASPARGGGRR